MLEIQKLIARHVEIQQMRVYDFFLQKTLSLTVFLNFETFYCTRGCVFERSDSFIVSRRKRMYTDDLMKRSLTLYSTWVHYDEGRRWLWTIYLNYFGKAGENWWQVLQKPQPKRNRTPACLHAPWGGSMSMQQPDSLPLATPLIFSNLFSLASVGKQLRV